MDPTDFLPDDRTIAGIKADIEAYERQRIGARRSLFWRVPLALGSLLLAVFALATAFNRFANPYEQWHSTPHVFLYFGALVLAYPLYNWATSPATRLQQGFRERLLPTIFGFVEGFVYAQGKEPESFQHLPREAIGAYDRARFDDCLAGTYQGFAFELYEVHLTDKTDKSELTRFRGVVVAFQTESSFPGRLVATRKSSHVLSFFRGLFNGKPLDAVPSGTPEIDEVYDFRTDSPEAARPIIEGRLAQALGWLAESWPEEPARIALHEHDGFLLLPTSKNFFELPPISVPMDYQAHVAPLIADLASLLATAALVRRVSAAGGG